MKKKLVYTAIGLLGSLAFNSPASAQTEEFANSMLWSVVLPKAPADTSYLFGTIHVISAKDFIIKDKVWDAMSKSKVLVMELNMTDYNAKEDLEKGMRLPDGITLDKIIKKKKYDILNSYLMEGSGENLDDYNHTKPFFVTSALLDFYVEGTPASYESNLTQMAVGNKMEIHGLETVKSQIAIIDSIPYKEQATELLKMVEDDQSMRKEFNSIVQTYKAEDLNKLDSLLALSMPSERTRKLLIDNRNLMWTLKIIPDIRQQSCFIAVGAGHLAGKNGLITMLRQAGFNVEPVFDKPEEY